MSFVTITTPSNGAQLPLNQPVPFTGSATNGVTNIVLTADEEFDLGEVTVDTNGDWSLTRTFSSPGLRKITVTGYGSAGEALETDAITITLNRPSDSCANRIVLFTVTDGDTGAAKRVYKLAGDPMSAVFYVSGMTICVDGSPRAYCPGNKGLDTLANATTNGKVNGPLSPSVIAFDANGNPVVQQSTGCYVSETALQDPARSHTDQSRYVNAETIPYIVLPGLPNVRSLNLAPGDFAVAYNGATGAVGFALYGDVGPTDHLGEGSLFLAGQLGIPDLNARTGGANSGIFYLAFPGSRLNPSWSSDRTAQDIARAASPLFEQWGGRARLTACFSDLTG